MKLLFPLVAAVFLIGCVTTPPPQESPAAHQRHLWEQARANFLALGGRDHSKPAPTPAPRITAVPKPAPRVAVPPAPPTPAPRIATVPKPVPRVAVRPSAHITPPPTPKRVAVQPPPHVPPSRTPIRQPTIAAQTHTAHRATPTPSPRSKVARADETIYYWQTSGGRKPSPKQLAAEVKYARMLGKRPERLTPEERIWADEHY